ncbi:MAG: hypothetical protein ACREX8_10800, partial [Gammaproteobacteria bacterium]
LGRFLRLDRGFRRPTTVAFGPNSRLGGHCFQTPEMPDELFEAQYASLRREFANIERALER